VSLSRIYQPVPLVLHALIRLDEKASHHVARVLRAKTGDKLTVFNGSGSECDATIIHIDKKGVDVEMINFVTRNVESPIDIYLAQGIARGEKMDFIVQKAVELGVKKIIPLITERCNVRLDSEREEKRLLHWQSVAISACEQSGRNQIPEIFAPIAFKAWLPKVKADHLFVLSPHVRGQLPTANLPANTRIVLLIGPEGGLSDEETGVAIKHGFLSLNLGPRILRTETATIAAISIFQFNYGDIDI
jgi:16S rRNA (uracil1498-N3)-methyltransferase